MATSWTRRISFVCPTITVADRLAIVAGARTRHPAGATSGISGVTKRISQGRATADDAVPALCASLPGEIPEVPRPGRILARGEGETGTPRLPMEGNPAPFPLGMALQFEIDVRLDILAEAAGDRPACPGRPGICAPWRRTSIPATPCRSKPCSTTAERSSPVSPNAALAPKPWRPRRRPRLQDGLAHWPQPDQCRGHPLLHRPPHRLHAAGGWYSWGVAGVIAKPPVARRPSPATMAGPWP